MLMAQYLAFSSSFFAKSWKVWHQSKFDQMKSDLRQLSIIGKIVWQTLTWYPNSQKQDNIETHVGIHILTPLTPKNQRSFMYNPVLKKKLSNQTFEQYLSCKNLITGGPSQNMTTKTKELKLTNWTN